MVASIVAVAICYGLLPEGSLPATELGPRTSIQQGLFIEMFLTAQVSSPSDYMAVSGAWLI